jgi:hypothetical protein
MNGHRIQLFSIISGIISITIITITTITTMRAQAQHVVEELPDAAFAFD